MAQLEPSEGVGVPHFQVEQQRKIAKHFATQIKAPIVVVCPNLHYAIDSYLRFKDIFEREKSLSENMVTLEFMLDSQDKISITVNRNVKIIVEKCNYFMEQADVIINDLAEDFNFEHPR